MKFNFSLKGKRDKRNYTLVRSGLPDTQWDLYMGLLSAFLQGPLQEQKTGSVESLRQKIRDNEPEFLARLAIHLREELSLRELSFWLSAELAVAYGNDLRIGFLPGRLIRQPGELPEWLDYYAFASGKGRQRLPRPVKKALDDICNRLDEYQFGRYDRDLQLRLKAALRSLRPKAADSAHKILFGKILRDQFPVRRTWEQEWQVMHQQHYDNPDQRQVILRDKWKEGISSFRIGYSALLNNLQPMLCAGVSGKVLKLAAEYLGNAVAVGRSGQSPLRLLEAYRGLRRMDHGGTGLLSEALEQAALHSAWNRTDLGTNSSNSSGTSWVIAMDVSESMRQPVSGYSGIQRFDIGPLLAMILKSRGEQVITGIIGNTWKPVSLPSRPILGSTDQFHLRGGEAGYAINAHLLLQDLLRKKQVADKVMIFTDCRLWDNRSFNLPAGTDLGNWWKQYRQIAPQAKLYLVDLAGYGSGPLEMREEDVFLVAGWHERMFDILQTIEKGKEVLEAIR